MTIIQNLATKTKKQLKMTFLGDGIQKTNHICLTIIFKIKGALATKS